MTDGIQLVRNDETGAFGLYRPDGHRIETYIGDDRHEVHGEYLGINWHPVEQDTLVESIEAGIAELRADIEALRERNLTADQERELDRLELRLESQESVLEIAREVNDDGA